MSDAPQGLIEIVYDPATKGINYQLSNLDTVSALGVLEVVKQMIWTAQMAKSPIQESPIVGVPRKRIM